MSDLNPPITPVPVELQPGPITESEYVRPARYWLHILLFVLTLLTTTVVGARLQHDFDLNLPLLGTSDASLPPFPLTWIIHNPGQIVRGLPFSLTLMLILLAHELGHYVYCRRYRVDATLPFFIPAPTLIGTLGAFIRIRAAIRSRTALFDIGIAGPIAGFVFAVPVMFAGLLLSKSSAGIPPSDLDFGFPLIFSIGHWLAQPFSTVLRSTSLADLHMHPVAIAGWFGMFATSLNLLPGGQLDGGHILYAVWPKGHRVLSILTILLLVPLGLFYWVGWLVWAVLLGISGVRHHRVVEHPRLPRRRVAMSLLAFAMLIVTMTPAPFSNAAAWPFFEELFQRALHLIGR